MENQLITILLVIVGILVFLLIIMVITAVRKLIAYFQRLEERDVEKIEIEKKKLELIKQEHKKPKKE